MKKFSLLVIVCMLLMSGCNTKKDNKSDKQLIVGGSTSVQPVMEELAETYNKKNEGFITVQGGGSSVGAKGTMDGTFDVGMLSRNLKEEETGLSTSVIALDGIALIVNKDNPVKSLTLDQIKKIFTGEITNWKEVGGKDLEICVVAREEGSGTRDGFESIVGFKANELIKNAIIQNATGAIINNVNANPNAVGYISLGSLSDSVKLVAVENVMASVETIMDKTYPIQRPFMIVVKEGNTSAEAFYNFIYSEEGKAIIKKYKYIPVERNK